MTDQLVLRPALLADGPAVVALWQACGLVADYNPPMADFERALTSQVSTILVAEQAGKIVGAVMAGDDGHRGWIYYLAVSPALRKRGIARRLLTEVEAWADARGVRKIQLMVRPSNSEIQEFYEQTGYGETPRLVMAKWLDKEVAGNPPPDRS
ncbi:GNAT family acetyltransferase [Henriciella aquimarina]|uniref:GNAT family acetyltransferase n=1 Tax=Henriciella aquimarina TaxID=545261 RepID=UPI0009FCACDB|nr:GNAT family acetyltransferase [Henriciella aquimarina]